MQQRLEYIDYTKGFAILLMVFGHVEVNNPAIFNWIYSFHMPIFFLICGILLYEKEKKNKLNIKKLIITRIQQLGIPYIVFSFILVIYFWILQLLSNTEIDYTYLKEIISLQGVLALWFLPCYFVAEVGCAVCIKSNSLFITIPFALFIVLFFYFPDKNMHIINLTRMLLGMNIVFIGYLISKYQLKLRIKYVVPLLLLASIASQIQGHTSMHELYIPNLFFYCLIFLLFSLTFFSLFEYIEKNQELKLLKRFLSFWGKNTIVVLCTHNILIEIFRLIDFKLFNSVIRDSGLIGSIPLTIVILLLEIPIIYLANHQLYFLFGKKHA